jgi:spermidine/putrescine transport system permease protein
MIKITEKRALSWPPLLYLILMFLVPMALMLIIAFMEPGDYGGVKPLISHIDGKYHLDLNIDSFILVFSSAFVWQLMLRSIIYSLVTTVICLILSYPLSLMIARSTKKYRDLLLLLVIIPFWSCFLIRVYAWMIILGPDSGVTHVINDVIMALGFPPVNLLYSTFAVIICLVYVNLPFMILPLYANLEKHEMDLLDAGRDLGASRFQLFWKVTVPLSLPGVLVGSALVFIPCIGMFVVPELVGSNCSLMIGNLIKQQFLQGMNWPLGTVTSIVMTVSVLSISLIVGFIAKNSNGLKYANK